MQAATNYVPFGRCGLPVVCYDIATPVADGNCMMCVVVTCGCVCVFVVLPI